MVRITGVHTIGKTDVDALFEAPTERLINIPRMIGCRQHHDDFTLLTVRIEKRIEFKHYISKITILLGSIQSVHLNQQFRLETSTGLMLGVGASAGTQRIDFIDENRTGRMIASLRVSYKLTKL